MGVIYYVGADDMKLVKIGYTSGDPDKRIKALQTGCPHELVLVAAHDGTIEDEHWLHEHFAEHCVRGEWFTVSKEVFQHIIQVIWLAGSACLKAKLPLEDWPEWLTDGMREIIGAVQESGVDLAALDQEQVSIQ